METEQTTRPGEEAAPVGPFVHLHTYLNGMRHWAALTAEGEPRPVHVQFLELQREGIAGLSRVLNALVAELYPMGHAMRHMRIVPGQVTFGLLIKEQHDRETAWNVNAGAIAPQHGNVFTLEQLKSRTNYGEVYSRANRQMTYTVQVPHVITEEEARQFAERGGEVPLKVGGISLQRAPDPPANSVASESWRRWAEVLGLDVFGSEMRDLLQPARATAEQIGRRWAEVFAAEVKDLLGDEPDAERVAAFATYCAELPRVIGTANGKPAWERMENETQGQQVLAAFHRVTVYLNTLLGELAEGYTSEEPAMNEQRITWLGTKAELAHVVMELEEMGWIRRGRSWAKLAGCVWSVFQDEQGQPLDLPTLKQYIKPSGNGKVDDGFKFEISPHPEMSKGRASERLRKRR